MKIGECREHEQVLTSQDWEPFPGAPTEVLQRQEREIGYGGSRGGCKTETTFPFIFDPDYIMHPHYEGLVIRKNSTDLGEWLRRARVFIGSDATFAGNPVEIKLRWGGVIETGHLKDKDAYEKYLGSQKQKIVVEQAEQIPDENLYLKLLSCNRSIRYPELRPQTLSTANPGGRGHAWYKRRFIDMAYCKTYTDERGNTRIFIPSTVDDNPALLQNDPEYVAFLEGLPEPLRSAWRYGKWDLFVGQYFINFGDHLAEEPFKLEAKVAEGRCFGSFDYGSGMNGVSSYGHWWIDPHNVPHRTFTWTCRGMTATEQAEQLYDYILSFPLCGVLPVKIFYDWQMDTKPGVEKNRSEEWAPIDYFKTKFGNRVKWQPANKNRVNGWQIMLDYFSRDSNTGLAKMKYWPEYNGTFEETVPLMVHDDNNPADVMKCEVDHTCDECRYGLVGIKTMFSNEPENVKRSAMDVRQKDIIAHDKIERMINYVGKIKGEPVVGW